MRSMTGFGRGEASTPEWKIEIELTGVNRKQLDIAINLPSTLLGLEGDAKRVISEAISRGRVSGKATLTHTGGKSSHLIFDQSLAEQWRSDAQQRLAASAGAETALTSPVSLSFSVSNSAYLASISIAEPARDILWRGSPDAPFVSTGSSGQQDPRTGAPAPRSFFELPLGQTDTTIEVAYIDFNGERQGPYAFPFAGKRESFNANRRLLEATTTSWLSFRDYEGKRLLYFTHLMTYRGGLDAIHYGLNQPQPDTPFTFPPWQQDGLAPIDATTPVYLEVPVTTEYATVQLTFKDGSQSGVQRINYR